jgi:hypothetical protein
LGYFLDEILEVIMTSIVPFQFQSLTIRTIIIDDEVWWVGKDVCAALGYKDPSTAIRNHCKGALKQHPLQTAGGIQELRILSEPDVMRLMVNSTLPEAEPFERWVFEEVLPTIRKTGAYTAEKAIPADRPTKVFPEFFRIARLVGLDKNANSATLKKTGENVLALMNLTHMETEQAWFTPTDLGKRIGVSGRAFNLLLLEAGLQTKEGEHWQPTALGKPLSRLMDTTKRHQDGAMVQQMKWSQDVLRLINQEAA